MLFDFETDPPVAGPYGRITIPVVFRQLVCFDQSIDDLTGVPGFLIGIPLALENIVVTARLSFLIKETCHRVLRPGIDGLQDLFLWWRIVLAPGGDLSNEQKRNK